jgi:hypothetical protein
MACRAQAETLPMGASREPVGNVGNRRHDDICTLKSENGGTSMKEGLVFIYRVKHPEYGEIEVKAQDRLHAACEAGKAWGTPWTGIARECTYEKIGPAPAPAPAKKAAPRKRVQSKEAGKK